MVKFGIISLHQPLLRQAEGVNHLFHPCTPGTLNQHSRFRCQQGGNGFSQLLLIGKMPGPIPKGFRRMLSQNSYGKQVIYLLFTGIMTQGRMG